MILVLNKMDLINEDELSSNRDVFLQSVPGVVDIPISAAENENIDILKV